jgi:hypothetical protein
MTGLLSLHRPWRAAWLVVLTGIGFAVLVQRSATPSPQPAAQSPVCSSCDARHARLTKIRAALSERPE